MSVLDFEEMRRRSDLQREMQRERDRADRRRALIDLVISLAAVVAIGLLALWGGMQR